jgi:hypothetical protein
VVCFVSFKEKLCIWPLLKVALSFVFHHPLSPLDPGFEITYQHCYVNPTANYSDPVQEYWQTGVVAVKPVLIYLKRKK